MGDPRLRLRHSKQVLDEDEYLAALGRIIERDYFPHSQQLQAHLRLLQEAERWRPSGTAGDSDDSRNMHRIEALMQRISTERRSMQSSATHGAAPGSDPADPYAHHTVDSFLAAHTSEDNASFEALQLRDKAERRRKHHWLYEPGEDAEYSRRAALMDPTAILLAGSYPSSSSSSAASLSSHSALGFASQLLLTDGAAAATTSSSSSSNNSSTGNSGGGDGSGVVSSTAEQRPGMLMLYYKGGQQLSAAQRADLDRRLDALVRREGGSARPAMPEGSKFRVRNHLMFPPDSDDTHDAGAGAFAPPRQGGAGSSSNAGMRAPKILQRRNTALPGSAQELIESLQAPSGTFERSHSPSVYSEFSGYSGYTEGLEASGPGGHEAAAARRYRPVPMSPHREAGREGDEPPMTWGVVGPPLSLDEGSRFARAAPVSVSSSSSRLPVDLLLGADDCSPGGARFSMSLSRRDELAHGLDRTARRRDTGEGADRHMKGLREKDRDRVRRGEGRSAAATALASRLSGGAGLVFGGMGRGTGATGTTPGLSEASLLRASYGQTPGAGKLGAMGHAGRSRGATPARATSSSSQGARPAVMSAALANNGKLAAADMAGLMRL